MYYTVYQITNKINGKIYVGAHQTEDLNDGYMGSGAYIKNAINKYGVENFDKVFLHYFDDVFAMFDKEAEIVNEDFVAREDTYNLNLGGIGGSWHSLNHGVNMDKNLRYNNERQAAISGYKHRYDLPEEAQQRMIEGSKKGGVAAFQAAIERNPNVFIHALENARRVIEENYDEVNEKRKTTLGKINHQQGVTNSMYGSKRIWICNDELKLTKRLEKTNIELQTLLSNGWRLGHLKVENPPTGKNTSQYGRVYIFNEVLKESKSVKKDSPILQSLLDDGWKYGRKIKWNCKGKI